MSTGNALNRLNSFLRALRALSLVAIVSLLLPYCSGLDRNPKFKFCEQNNRICHQNCDPHNADFAQSKMATQSISRCDQNCEATYQACLVRWNNRSAPDLDP
jgi:hypothetical protein